jgi:P2 family phage contractile tail tube protein
MAAARNVLKNINLYVDGRGQAGQVEEYNPPKITLKTEEFQGGGMYAPLELTMGHEKLETDFSLISYDPDVLALFGVAEGQQIQFTARGALESYDGSVTAVVHNMRGKIKEIDRGTWKPGEKPSLKISMALSYYKEVHGGRVIHEIDVENMVFVRNGVDLLSAIRGAIGI